MSDYKLQAADRFPAGVDVQVYRENRRQEPEGDPVTTVKATDNLTEVRGLEAATAYVAIAAVGAEYKSLRFLTPAGTNGDAPVVSEVFAVEPEEEYVSRISKPPGRPLSRWELRAVRVLVPVLLVWQAVQALT